MSTDRARAMPRETREGRDTEQGRLDTYTSLGRQLRIDSIRASSAAGSGHPTSSMSAADLMAVLLAKYLRYDFSAPDDARVTT